MTRQCLRIFVLWCPTDSSSNPWAMDILSLSSFYHKSFLTAGKSISLCKKCFCAPAEKDGTTAAVNIDQKSGLGIWSFALSLFALLLKIATVTDLLSSLFKNSNHERITLVAFNKRVTVSDSLCKKEQHKWFARDSSESLSKTSNSIEKVQFLFNVFDSF